MFLIQDLRLVFFSDMIQICDNFIPLFFTIENIEVLRLLLREFYGR